VKAGARCGSAVDAYRQGKGAPRRPQAGRARPVVLATAEGGQTVRAGVALTSNFTELTFNSLLKLIFQV